ncbi:ABC transporter ATP-binding protein [Candidatus Omnitrophota bacterium]
MKYMVELSGVSKRFVIPSSKRRPALLRRIIASIRKQAAYQTLWALNKITLQIHKGETIGVIGLNGSGKSTLMRIVAGIYKPTMGQVRLMGEAAPVVGLWAGFMPELSVRDNVFLFGAILGLERRALVKLFPAIIDFAELGEFINAQVRTLSSGMKMRLAFSTIRFAPSDILLFDEAVAVGDQAFKEKCLRTMAGLKKAGKTILLSSHNAVLIEELCDRTVLLHKGAAVDFGETAGVVRGYRSMIKSRKPSMS